MRQGTPVELHLYQTKLDNTSNPISIYLIETSINGVTLMISKSKSATSKANSPSEKVRSLEDIRRTLKEHMPELAERHKIKSLGIFGSYVRSEARSTSDVDLLVELSENPDIFKFMDLEEDLTALLGQKVDLVTKPALKGNRGNRILREVVPV
ncbi:MAG: Nucleotidyltransferase domain protein [Methanosaeta sp. PtaU1.Bin060]|nr:MAG: Nucleotidyltransferase domain protein [Methanosaeta sp. PtaU1.Bin060]